MTQYRYKLEERREKARLRRERKRLRRREIVADGEGSTPKAEEGEE